MHRNIQFQKYLCPCRQPIKQMGGAPYWSLGGGPGPIRRSQQAPRGGGVASKLHTNPGAPWPRMAAGRFANEDQQQSGRRAPPTLTGRSAGHPLLATWTQRRREETPLVTWSPFLRLLREGKVRRHSSPSRALIIGAANQIRE